MTWCLSSSIFTDMARETKPQQRGKRGRTHTRCRCGVRGEEKSTKALPSFSSSTPHSAPPGPSDRPSHPCFPPPASVGTEPVVLCSPPAPVPQLLGCLSTTNNSSRGGACGERWGGGRPEVSQRSVPGVPSPLIGHRRVLHMYERSIRIFQLPRLWLFLSLPSPPAHASLGENEPSGSFPIGWLLCFGSGEVHHWPLSFQGRGEAVLLCELSWKARPAC